MISAKQWLYEMKPYNPPLEGRSEMIRLDFNENTFGPSPKVKEALSKIALGRLSCYPEYKGLADKIANYAGVKFSQLIPTNGSDEAIKLVFDCFISPKEEVLIPSPTYVMFNIYAESTGAKINKVPYNEDLSFPTDRVLSSISNKTKLIIVCTPNNPTGTSISNAGLKKILIKAKNAIVLVDEAYYEFSGNSAVSLIKEFDNLIITRTFSKAFGLAAFRIGYLISNKETINLLKKVYSPYAVNYLAKISAEAALGDLGYLKKYVSENKKSKKTLETTLNLLGIKYFNSDANFLIAKFGSSRKFVLNQLQKEGILLRDRGKYPLLEGCIRITVGDKEKNAKLIKVLKGVFDRPLLIFDIDGVLIGVSKSYRMAIKNTVEFFSKEQLPLAEIQDWKNRTGLNNDWELTKAILDSRKANIAMKEIIDKFQEFYLGKNFGGLIKNEKLLIKKNLLENLRQNYCLAIFTGRPKKEAKFILDFFNIRDYFSEIVCMEDVPKGREKPDPFGLELIRSSTNFRKAIYFGDSVSDILAAKGAKNTEAIGVMPNAVFSKNTLLALKNAGARKVLQSINDLKGAIK